MNFNMFYSKVNTVVALAALTVISYSCTSNAEPSGEGNLTVSAKSTLAGDSGLAKRVDSVTNNSIKITKLLLNIKEIELELALEKKKQNQVAGKTIEDDKEWDDDGVLDYNDEIELQGPFEIDLLSGQVKFLDVTIPKGKFEKLEFKFAPSENQESDLFEKSILVEGKVNNQAFVFWHNFTEEVSVDYEDPKFNIVISEVDEGVVINFDINQVFNANSGIDLSQATDGNQDGIVEISPTDTDGNNDLANTIKLRLKEVIDLLED